MMKPTNDVTNGPKASPQYSLAIEAEGRFLFVTALIAPALTSLTRQAFLNAIERHSPEILCPSIA